MQRSPERVNTFGKHGFTDTQMLQRHSDYSIGDAKSLLGVWLYDTTVGSPSDRGPQREGHVWMPVEAFATPKMNDDVLLDDEAHVFLYTERVDCIEDIRQRQSSARWVVSMEIPAKK